MPIPGFLKNIFSSGAGALVKEIKDLVDESKFSAEEKAAFEVKLLEIANAHTEKMAESARVETESYLKDTQNARETNARVQESDKASWLAKNLAYCIDAFIIFVWGFLTVYLLVVMLNLVKKVDGVDYTAVTAVWGGVTAFAGTVLNFHRGTSRGSEEKQKQITTMIGK